MAYFNDYNKDTFWSSFDVERNTRRFYIKLNGVLIEVEKDVYYTMFNSYRKCLRTARNQDEIKQISLDSNVNGEGLYSVLYREDNQNVLDKIESEMIQDVIQQLDEIDKTIIFGIFYEDKSETEIAKHLHITQQAVSKRKKKILKELKSVIDTMIDKD